MPRADLGFRIGLQASTRSSLCCRWRADLARDGPVARSASLSLSLCLLADGTATRGGAAGSRTWDVPTVAADDTGERLVDREREGEATVCGLVSLSVCAYARARACALMPRATAALCRTLAPRIRLGRRVQRSTASSQRTGSLRSGRGRWRPQLPERDSERERADTEGAGRDSEGVATLRCRWGAGSHPGRSRPRARRARCSASALRVCV